MRILLGKNQFHLWAHNYCSVEIGFSCIQRMYWCVLFSIYVVNYNILHIPILHQFLFLSVSLTVSFLPTALALQECLPWQEGIPGLIRETYSEIRLEKARSESAAEE